MVQREGEVHRHASRVLHGQLGVGAGVDSAVANTITQVLPPHEEVVVLIDRDDDKSAFCSFTAGTRPGLKERDNAAGSVVSRVQAGQRAADGSQSSWLLLHQVIMLPPVDEECILR